MQIPELTSCLKGAATWISVAAASSHPIVFSSAIMTSSNVTGWKTGPSRKQDPFSSGQFVTGYTCKLAACKLTSISLYP